jgi:hypothetical protein
MTRCSGGDAELLASRRNPSDRYDGAEERELLSWQLRTAEASGLLRGAFQQQLAVLTGRSKQFRLNSIGTYIVRDGAQKFQTRSKTTATVRQISEDTWCQV